MKYFETLLNFTDNIYEDGHLEFHVDWSTEPDISEMQLKDALSLSKKKKKKEKQEKWQGPWFGWDTCRTSQTYEAKWSAMADGADKHAMECCCCYCWCIKPALVAGRGHFLDQPISEKGMDKIFHEEWKRDLMCPTTKRDVRHNVSITEVSFIPHVFKTYEKKNTWKEIKRMCRTKFWWVTKWFQTRKRNIWYDFHPENDIREELITE